MELQLAQQLLPQKQNGLINDKVDIEFSTGRLTISIDENNSIHMKGPVSDIEEINFKI